MASAILISSHALTSHTTEQTFRIYCGYYDKAYAPQPVIQQMQIYEQSEGQTMSTIKMFNVSELTSACSVATRIWKGCGTKDAALETDLKIEISTIKMDL